MSRSGSRAVEGQFDRAVGFTTSARREPMTAMEVGDVLKFRDRTRAGWQACAEYCGRNVEDVRRACEAVLKGTAMGAAAMAARVERAAVPSPVRTPAMKRGDRLCEVLRDGPLTLTQLAFELSCKSDQVRQAIGAMVAAGRVETRAWRGGIVVGLPGAAFPRTRARPPPVRRRGASSRPAILDFLAKGPASAAAIAAAIGKERPYVSVILNELTRMGLVVVQSGGGQGRGYIYSRAEDGQ